MPTDARTSAAAERSIDVFFYGLFMDADALRAKGFAPARPRRARLRDWGLRVGRRATLWPSPGEVVHGVLMAMTQTEIARLYAEPSVAVYRPEAVLTELADGSLVAALCFNLESPPGPAEANPAYARQLRALGERLGFPADYLAALG